MISWTHDVCEGWAMKKKPTGETEKPTVTSVPNDTGRVMLKSIDLGMWKDQGWDLVKEQAQAAAARQKK